MTKVTQLTTDTEHFDELQEARNAKVTPYDLVISSVGIEGTGTSAHYRIFIPARDADMVRNGFYNQKEAEYLAKHLSAHHNSSSHITQAIAIGGERFSRSDFNRAVILNLVHNNPLKIRAPQGERLEVMLEKV